MRLLVYNFPKLRVRLGAYLAELRMQFRHWIASEMSACLPIQARLQPQVITLCSTTHREAEQLSAIRTPIVTCRHCGGEVKDYGGHPRCDEPKGLKDAWTGVSPVRH